MNDMLLYRRPRSRARAIRSGLCAVAFLLAASSQQASRAATDEAIAGTFAAEHGATSTPTGDVQGRVNTATGVMTFALSFAGLSGPVTVAHFHGPAAPGQDAGVLEPIRLTNQDPLRGTVILKPSELVALRNGLVYVNLHTARYPAGEARAQLHLQADVH